LNRPALESCSQPAEQTKISAALCALWLAKNFLRFTGVLLLKGLEFSDCTVKEKKPYQYRVLAENEGGISAPSAESAPVKAKPFKGRYSFFVLLLWIFLHVADFFFPELLCV